MTALFDHNASTTETSVVEGSYFDSLVGDDKKFKTPEDLAKGKHESDNIFIPQLQKENAASRTRIQELETQLQERITLEEFMKELKTPGNDDEVTTPRIQTPNVTAPSADEHDRIGKIIDARLTEQRKKEQIQANVSSVQQALQAAWGTDWQTKLIEKAKELGLPQQQLAAIAEESPTGFLNIVLPGVIQRQDPNADIPPRTRMSSGIPSQDVSVRNKAYYDKLKKTDSKLYYSEAVTAQRHKDAQRLGESFFN